MMVNILNQYNHKFAPPPFYMFTYAYFTVSTTTAWESHDFNHKQNLK